MRAQPTSTEDESVDRASTAAVAELTRRLGRVMRPEYVPTWLCSTRIDALDGARPIELIQRGEIAAVARAVSELDDPGAV